ncbi:MULTISPECIES: restriction endonuclease subunit S [Psychrobacter]|jgi:type I restriction enzyme S subunit|uniref:Restriction endonuclease subunit S n=1 Tax=Psychrobacter namhaensis TaxID=292734 RepID=A0ABW8L7W6_9GAMM|nr:restriction endonuclease subunit S [Psychrobacter sp. CCUG 69069]MCD1280177.1 restriction endonuclease subunit S [Psychrobacter sp. CCUG 69069]|tara:strand:+ start:2641 stop:4341 length:1701 start_codon:yes stop_codon:yes gene_type:complete
MNVKTSLEVGKDASKPEQLITAHIDIWTSAILAKSSSGRGSSKKYELYGISKLRELILELAVRGKLVPQDDNDEPASVLLEKIAVEKAQLIKKGRIKKVKVRDKINEDEKSFELPRNWSWIRLSNIYDVRDGTHDSPKYQASGYPLVTSKNLASGTLSLDDVKYISTKDHQKIAERSAVVKGDILFAMIGTIGNPVIVDIDDEFSIKNVALFKPINGLLNSMQFLRIQLIVASKYLKNNASGAVQKFASLTKLREQAVALPPLAEQQRIVAKVDELMLLCDHLEQQTEASIEAHATLVEVLLGTLTDSVDADELAQNWARISEHFDSLFTTEQSIDALKQTVLQLAVMGQLVPQNPDDEPASVLLEKERLIRESKIKQPSSWLEITENEKPFESPESWIWLRFGDVYPLEYGNNLPKPKRSNTGEYNVYGSNGIVGSHNAACVKSSCIVVGRKGSAGALNISLDDGCWVTDVAYSCIPIKGIDLYFAFMHLKTLGLDSLGKGIKPGLNRNEAYSLPVAIPPLSEQHLIVAKVDELMAICDQLKEKLQQSQETQVQLTDALVDRALE